ncbi:MAG: type II secretion system protein [Armatimonadota bacterium]
MNIKKPKGMTLIELLVAAAITVLITSFIATTLIISLKYWKIIDLKSEVQLNAMVGIEGLKQDISSSNIGSFTVNSSYPKAVSFQSALYNGQFYANADGTPAWQTYIIYYLAANTTDLRKREIYSPGAIAPLSQPALVSYCDGTGVLKAIDVNDFSAALGSDYVDILIKTRMDYKGSENSTSLTMRVYPKN